EAHAHRTQAALAKSLIAALRELAGLLVDEVECGLEPAVDHADVGGEANRKGVFRLARDPIMEIEDYRIRPIPFERPVLYEDFVVEIDGVGARDDIDRARVLALRFALYGEGAPENVIHSCFSENKRKSCFG